MRYLTTIAVMMIFTSAFATEERWCGDGLPFSFLKDGQNILVVRMNQIATCIPTGGNNYTCAEELSGANGEQFEVTAEITKNGDLSFASKGQEPTVYYPCP